MSLDLSGYDLVTADTAELLTNVNGAWRELETWAAGHIVDIANLQLSVDNLAVNLEARFVANVNNNNRITQQYGAKIDQHIIDAGYAHGLLGDRITDLEDAGGIYPEISQVDAEAGTATVFSVWSAERVGQAITALGGGGVDLSDYTDTWNDPGDLNLIKAYVTNTQSGSGSLLLDLGVDGTPMFSVGKTGDAYSYDSYTDASNYSRGYISADTDVLKIGMEGIGSGDTDKTIEWWLNGDYAAMELSRSGAYKHLKFYNETTGALEGYFTAAASAIHMRTADNRAVVSLFSGNILLNPKRWPAASSEQFVYIGTDIQNSNVTRTLKSDTGGVSLKSGVHLKLAGGDAYDSGAVDRDGGDVVLSPGAPANSGDYGLILFENLPTSDPAVAGALWLNAGAPAISAG